LLGREFDEVIRNQVNNEPDKNHDCIHYKASAVVDRRKKGKQKNPEDSIVKY